MAMNTASASKSKKRTSTSAHEPLSRRSKGKSSSENGPVTKVKKVSPAKKASAKAPAKQGAVAKAKAAKPLPLKKPVTIVSEKKPAGRGATKSSDQPTVSRVPIAARRTAQQKKMLREEMILEKKKLRGARSRDADRIVVMVRDAFWLHVFWEISDESIQRTEAALGPDWYQARPVLRLLDVSSEDTTSSSESIVSDIEIHGGVNNWYIPLDGTVRSYRVDVGYATSRGRVFVLARSNVVTPPKPGSSDSTDGHWSSVRDDCDRIFAMSGGSDPYNNSETLQKFFEERFGRPMSAGSLSSYGSGALGPARRGRFHFDIDAELIVHGRTVSDARVSVHGEPVQLRKDGSFTLRFGLPDGRQILPATASTNDGIEERTIIIAIERNTKVLEPMIHDGQE
jgi:uncharacterized protein